MKGCLEDWEYQRILKYLRPDQNNAFVFSEHTDLCRTSQGDVQTPAAGAMQR